MIATTQPRLTSGPTAAPQNAERLPFSGDVRGVPRILLRIEGAVLLAAATTLYVHLGAGWGMFAGLFFTPDLAFLGYLLGPRAGAVAYNTTHSTLLYAALAAVALAFAPTLLPLAAIGAAHVGFDRMLGYGLKYGTAFGQTHLGAVGKQARR